MTLLDRESKVNSHIGISAYNIKDFTYSNLLTNSIKAGLSTYSKKTQVRTTITEFAEFINANFNTPEWQTIQTAYNGGLVIHRDTANFIEYVSNENETYISVFGNNAFVDSYINLIENNFSKGVSIEWYYSPNESPSTVYIDMARLPVNEMYPNVNGSLEQYYSDFIHSTANILILIGPPGTGKTTFLRGLISHYEGAKPYVTYDPKILDTDSFFSTFVTGSSNLLIVEDADNFLSPRSSGNDLISMFLNIGDGLISIKGKKIIFSTNLPSIKDIDSALLRPGRCHDVLTFDKLNLEQTKKLAEVMPAISVPNDNKDGWYLAELFHTMKSSYNRKSFGFV